MSESGKKRAYIKTMGCQMNVVDSEKALAALTAMGYEAAASPRKADLVLVNTCAIREKSEQKVMSLLGRFTRARDSRPGFILAVAGCVAQARAESLLERMPHVDIVVGTRALARLPELVERVRAGEGPIVDVGEEDGRLFWEPPRLPDPPRRAQAFVTIMNGCDNFCTYCVVPHVRGREKSREPEEIRRELSALASEGVREVTLLGQNVNSYGIKEGGLSFPELLKDLAGVGGISRIRFTTSHPKDLSGSLAEAFASLPKLCPHIHLPVQSGSNRILKKMNRGYTREQYLERVALLRNARPGISVTTDLIVGFPGETEEDFHETLSLVREVGFDGAYAFKYSDRPMAPASRFSEKLTEQEKGARLAALLEACSEVTLARHEALVGVTEEVLVEGRSKQSHEQWAGRTPANRIVNFEVPDPEVDYTARFVSVRILEAHPHSLWGRMAAAGNPDETAREAWNAA